MLFIPRIISSLRRWHYAAHIRKIPVGSSYSFRTVNKRIEILRKNRFDVIAYSDKCPHLGCRVKWKTLENQFFCPCHSALFDESGKALTGPPAKLEQNLVCYPVRLIWGHIFVYIEGMRESW